MSKRPPGAGKRGPLPGFRRAAAALAAELAPPAGPTAADLYNPRKLAGDDLKSLAHRMGMAKSSLAGMPDEKIREQLRYITADRAETEPA